MVKNMCYIFYMVKNLEKFEAFKYSTSDKDYDIQFIIIT